MNANTNDVRPWGQYWVLEDTENYKIKRIEVNPGGRLSYQFHHHRAEVWVIISGSALVTLDDRLEVFKAGQVVQIPLMAKHRVENMGSEPLVMIEVQTGSYFGEDDIIRLSDDYQRS